MSPNCVYMWIYARPFASQVFLSHFYVEICSFFCIPRVLISFLCRYMFILLHHMGPNLVHVDTCSFFYIRWVFILFLSRYELIRLLVLLHTFPNLISMAIPINHFVIYSVIVKFSFVLFILTHEHFSRQMFLKLFPYFIDETLSSSRQFLKIRPL